MAETVKGDEDDGWEDIGMFKCAHAIVNPPAQLMAGSTMREKSQMQNTSHNTV